MKNQMASVLLLVLFLLSSQMETTHSQQYSCVDLCQTGCVARYLPDAKKVSRCERKCSIDCNRKGKGPAAKDVGRG
ncbi:hypothetical protein ACHQM5_004060 [Ranunculus cassubicifolius]